MPFTNPESRTVEAAVTAFEAALQTGARPVIEDFLPAGPGAHAAAVEMIHIDLEYRLKGGESARVEDYLARFAAVGGDPDVRRELVRTEHRFRARREPGLRRADYAARFPDDWQHLPPDPAHAESTAPEPPVTTSACGPTIPGLTVLRVLGEGGMGVVYLARDEGLNREVAVKTLRSGLHATGEQRNRFRTEAEAVARLPHDGIVRVLSAGEHDGVPYFVMEHLSGGTLATRLAGAPQPPAQSARWIAELAGAVAAAHAAGVIHRDLKPANVLLDSAGRVKVADFGLAQLADGSGASTQTGAVLGTPSYMAPEQAAGRTKDIGPAADVYSLGAILYECLTGRPPFRAESREDTLLQVLLADPIAPRQFAPSVPRNLETICLKCLEKDPARRYHSAAAVADDLGRFLDGRPIAARAAGPAERAWRWCRRNPALAALVALVAFAVSGVVGGSLAFAQQARWHAKDLEVEGERVRAALARAETEKATADRERARAEELLRQMSESDAATQSVLYEFVVDEVFPGFQAGADPKTVCDRLTAFESRARARFAAHPLLRASALTFLANARVALAGVSNAASKDDANRSAERMYLECLDLARTHAKGTYHPLTLQSRNNLLTFLLSQKPSAELVHQARECHADCARTLGPEHSLTITCHANVGFALVQVEDHAAAEIVLRDCLAARERTQGPNFPQTYDTRSNLCDAVERVRGSAAAAPERKALRESARRQFGPTGWQTVQSARAYALGEIECGRPEVAVELLREVVAVHDQVPSSASPQFRAECRLDLGEALLKANKPAEAETVLRACVESRKEFLRAGHWAIGGAEISIGISLCDQNRHAAAFGLLTQGFDTVWADREAAKSEAGEQVVRKAWARAECAIGECATVLQKHNALLGIAPLRYIVEAHDRVPGVDPVVRANYQVALGSVLIAGGKPAEAELVLLACVEGRRKVHPAGHWAVGDAEIYLGLALCNQKRHSAGVNLLTEGYRKVWNDRETAKKDAGAQVMQQAWTRTENALKLWDPMRREEFVKQFPPPK